MRARDECPADLGGVPAGYDTEAKRLFCLDVARREILHWMLSAGTFDPASNKGVQFSVVQREHLCRSALSGEPGKVRKYRRDQVAMMCVGGSEVSHIQIQDVTRLCRRLSPRGCRHRKQLEFDHALPVTQQSGVGLDVGEHAADIGGLLRR